MDSLGTRLWKFLTRSPRHSVTHAGLAFTAAMLVVGVAAAVSANNLLFLILAAMVSTMLVSGLISRLSLAGLELDLALPEHIAARRTLAGRIYLRNAKSWSSSFSVHLGSSGESVLTTLYFPVIPGGATLDETIEVRFKKRGVYRENGFVLSTGFPFGFIVRRAQVTLRREVLVYPSLDSEPFLEELLAAVRGDMTTQFRGRGHDFYRIRPYEALESARHVDWKATAHTGALQVREYALEQERLLEMLLDLDLSVEEGEWFERAVEACAFLVWNMALRGARVRFRTQEFDLAMPQEGDVYAILRYLATVTPSRLRPTPAPQDENSCRVVFTASDPKTLEEAGWVQARVIGPTALGLGAASPHGDEPDGAPAAGSQA
jgi:uncharacterized protein (DUF58 family)